MKADIVDWLRTGIPCEAMADNAAKEIVRLRAAVADERKACAAVARDMSGKLSATWKYPEEIAAAIERRGHVKLASSDQAASGDAPVEPGA